MTDFETDSVRLATSGESGVWSAQLCAPAIFSPGPTGDNDSWQDAGRGTATPCSTRHETTHVHASVDPEAIAATRRATMKRFTGWADRETPNRWRR